MSMLGQDNPTLGAMLPAGTTAHGWSIKMLGQDSVTSPFFNVRRGGGAEMYATFDCKFPSCGGW